MPFFYSRRLDVFGDLKQTLLPAMRATHEECKRNAERVVEWMVPAQLFDLVCDLILPIGEQRVEGMRFGGATVCETQREDVPPEQLAYTVAVEY